LSPRDQHGKDWRTKSARRPEITLKGNTIKISSTVPWTLQQEMHLGVNGTLELTFQMEFDAAKLAKFIEKQGGPPYGMSIPAWAKKLAQAVGTAGLVEAAQKGIDLISKFQPQ
jgi:hypothetical protein